MSISQVLFASPVAGSDTVEFHGSDVLTQDEIDNMLASYRNVSCLLPGGDRPVLPGDEQPSVIYVIPDGVGEQDVLYVCAYPMQSLSLVAA